MSDCRVVEKIDECVGEFTLVVTFRTVDDHFILSLYGCLWP
jgi:hypothetical protein